MKTVLADTSFYVAILSPADALHESAIAWSQQASLTVVVTEFVLLELGNFLAQGRARAQLTGLVKFLRNDPRTVVVPLATALFDTGLSLFARRPDKEWSFTDCISFVVMKAHGLTEALTADHHFEQAGFKPLLRYPID
jgi:predicted nucleic acid-binding protein